MRQARHGARKLLRKSPKNPYFQQQSAEDDEVRRLADALYRKADWQWMQNGAAPVSHGWTPEKGFLRYRWHGYDEALVIYLPGLGSPTHPLPSESYYALASTYKWKKIYGIEFLYSGPLFIHQLSHVWIDFRDIRDEFMRQHQTGSIDFMFAFSTFSPS